MQLSLEGVLDIILAQDTGALKEDKELIPLFKRIVLQSEPATLQKEEGRLLRAVRVLDQPSFESIFFLVQHIDPVCLKKAFSSPLTEEEAERFLDVAINAGFALDDLCLYHDAILVQPPSVIQILLNKGLNVEQRPPDQMSPLFLSAKEKKYEIMWMLYEAGACPFTRNKETILSLFDFIYTEKEQVERFFQDFTYLADCVDFSALRSHLQNNEQLIKVIESVREKGQNPLHFLFPIFSSRFIALKGVIRNSTEQELKDYFLEHRDWAFPQFIYPAILTDIPTLVEHFYRLNSPERLNLLFGGSLQHHSEKAAQVFLKEGANVDAELRNGETPLSIAAGKASTSLFSKMLDLSENPQKKVKGERTLLMRAVQESNWENAKLLVKRGARLLDSDAVGFSFVDYTLEREKLFQEVFAEHERVIEDFSQENPYPYICPLEFLLLKVRCGFPVKSDAEEIALLLDPFFIKYPDFFDLDGKNVRNLLHLFSNSKEILSHILSLDTEKKLTKDHTILFEFIANDKNEEGTLLLLDHGLDIHRAHPTFSSPLYYAIRLGKVATVRKLLEKGAYPFTHLMDKRTAYLYTYCTVISQSDKNNELFKLFFPVDDFFNRFFKKTITVELLNELKKELDRNYINTIEFFIFTNMIYSLNIISKSRSDKIIKEKLNSTFKKYPWALHDPYFISDLLVAIPRISLVDFLIRKGWDPSVTVDLMLIKRALQSERFPLVQHILKLKVDFNFKKVLQMALIHEAPLWLVEFIVEKLESENISVKELFPFSCQVLRSNSHLLANVEEGARNDCTVFDYLLQKGVDPADAWQHCATSVFLTHLLEGFPRLQEKKRAIRSAIHNQPQLWLKKENRSPKANPLLIPLLFPPLFKTAVVHLTTEELVMYRDQLESRYPNLDFDTLWVKLGATVSKGHMTAVKRAFPQLPKTPKTLDIQKSLLAIFDQIVFTETDQKGCVNLKKVSDDGIILYKYDQNVKATLRRKLKEFCRNVAERDPDTKMIGVPKREKDGSETPERTHYFDTLQSLVQSIALRLEQEKDPFTRSETVLAFCIAAYHCGTRYMLEASQIFWDLSGTPLTFSAKIAKIYHDMRIGIVEHLSNRNTHWFNELARLLMKEKGLNVNTFKDPIFLDRNKEIIKNELIPQFDKLYSVVPIYKRMVQAIKNGELLKSQLIDWFRENPPPLVDGRSVRHYLETVVFDEEGNIRSAALLYLLEKHQVLHLGGLIERGFFELSASKKAGLLLLDCLDDESSALALIEQGACLDVCNFRGKAIHNAALDANGTVFEKIARKTKDLDERGPLGRTPLMLAVMSDEDRVTKVQQLLALGADRHLKDEMGKTALDQVKGNPQLAMLLKGKRGKVQEEAPPKRRCARAANKHPREEEEFLNKKKKIKVKTPR